MLSVLCPVGTLPKLRCVVSMATEEGPPGQQQEADAGIARFASFQGAAWKLETWCWAFSTNVEERRSFISMVSLVFHWTGLSNISMNGQAGSLGL